MRARAFLGERRAGERERERVKFGIGGRKGKLLD